jgi:hypothetical protein
MQVCSFEFELRGEHCKVGGVYIAQDNPQAALRVGDSVLPYRHVMGAPYYRIPVSVSEDGGPGLAGIMQWRHVGKVLVTGCAGAMGQEGSGHEGEEGRVVCARFICGGHQAVH